MIADAVVHLIGARLPEWPGRDEDWPIWPITLVSGHNRIVPPFPFVRAYRQWDRDAVVYAWGPLAFVLRGLDWWEDHRWALERWCIRRGILTGPEGGYFHEFSFAPVRQWFRAVKR